MTILQVNEKKIEAKIDNNNNIQINTPKFRLRSKFLLSLASFLGLNLLLSFFTPFQFDPYKFNYRGWTWWTFNELRQTKNIKNLALLGSSTMVSAIAGCDANYLGKSLDLTNHHRSSYLEAELKKAMGGDFDSFSLAAPGQMPSDAYITLKGMVASATRPDIVMYGLAPRDFIDSTLTAPGDTDAFKYLTRLVNIDDVAQKVFRSPFSKLDWLFQRTIYVYNNSLDIRLKFQELTISLMNNILPSPWTKTPFTYWDRQKLLPNYLPAEISPEAVMAGPIDQKTAEKEYTDNTMEYVRRYRNPDKQTFKTQMFFLEKIAEFCHKERIELLIFNMPITVDNLRLLKPGGYISYLQKLREFGISHAVAVYDLNDLSRYQRTDFHDSVHLNAFGGKKFFDDIISAVYHDPRVHTILQMSGEHLATHKKLASSKPAPMY